MTVFTIYLQIYARRPGRCFSSTREEDDATRTEIFSIYSHTRRLGREDLILNNFLRVFSHSRKGSYLLRETRVCPPSPSLISLFLPARWGENFTQSHTQNLLLQENPNFSRSTPRVIRSSFMYINKKIPARFLSPYRRRRRNHRAGEQRAREAVEAAAREWEGNERAMYNDGGERAALTS